MYDIQKINIWKDQPVKTSRNEYLDMDIVELGLSVRSYNCLRRASCNTVADVIQIMESDKGLLSIRNLGKTSYKEITEKIEEVKTLYPGATKENRAIKTTIKPAKKVWDTEIEAFGLSNYARTRLKNCGVNYVKDLYIGQLTKEPGWLAVRELFDKIPAN